MNRRLYFVLPDLESATRAANDLLLARVEFRRMHFVGPRGAPMDGLNEASVLQTSDVRHALFVGTGLGALFGAAVGVYLKLTTPWGYAFDVGTLIACVLGGALFGAWTSTLIGVSAPNARLSSFAGDFDAGRFVMMVDVPASRVREIESMLHARHPEAIDRGVEPTTPVFP